MLNSKRGIAVWLSWTLIIGLAVILGTLFYTWATSFTSDTLSDVSGREDVITLCSQVGISVTSVCQETQTLNINVSNSGTIRVDELLFSMFDIYGIPQRWQVNLSIDPAEETDVVAVKQGILAQADIIPVLHNDEVRIICESKAVIRDSVDFC